MGGAVPGRGEIGECLSANSYAYTGTFRAACWSLATCVHDQIRSVVTAAHAAAVDPYCASGYSRWTFLASAAPTMSVSSRG